jgi:hypothetical protein
VVEVLGGSRESHDVHRFIHHSSSIKLTRALPPIQQLKPLSAAVLDGDMIRAVVRAVASDQDGHTPGLTQPSPRHRRI